MFSSAVRDFETDLEHMGPVLALLQGNRPHVFLETCCVSENRVHCVTHQRKTTSDRIDVSNICH